MITVEIQGLGSFQFPNEKKINLLNWITANGGVSVKITNDPATLTLLQMASSQENN